MLEDASGGFPVGERPIVFTALDEGGHKRSCTSTLTVRDVTAPEITCGTFEGRVPGSVRATITDACGATAVVKDLVCVLVSEDGEEDETCTVTARGEAATGTQGRDGRLAAEIRLDP